MLYASGYDLVKNIPPGTAVQPSTRDLLAADVHGSFRPQAPHGWSFVGEPVRVSLGDDVRRRLLQRLTDRAFCVGACHG